MAFNLLAVAQSPIDWTKTSELYRQADRLFEVFPIADPGEPDALGISIPTNHFNQTSWQSASRFLLILASAYPLTVFEMYGGHAVDLATYVPDGLRC